MRIECVLWGYLRERNIKLHAVTRNDTQLYKSSNVEHGALNKITPQEERMIMKKMSPRKIAIKKGDLTYEGRPCKEGHTTKYASSYYCVECSKIWRLDNKDSYKEYFNQYRITHKEELIQYRINNNEHIREQQKTHKSTPEFKKRRNEREKERRQEDPVFKMKHYLAKDVRTFYKLRGGKKEGRTHELLGYSAKECNDHIETLFQEGMTWKNRSEWDIDHINPQSNFTSIDQLKECYALSNLKPEWKEWNLWKGNRFVGSSEEFPMPKKAA